MSHSWAQFEANLRRELSKGGEEENTSSVKKPSAVAALKKNDLFLFGSGSVSNLLVVSCHMCNALLKPAFLSHHISKIHGGVKTEGSSSSSSGVNPSVTSVRHATPPSKLFKHPPRPKIIEQIIREEEGFTKTANKNKAHNKSANSGVVVKTTKKAAKKGGSKKKQPKSKVFQKPVVEEKESDKSIMKNLTFSVASPPPSPPSLYPSPPRHAKTSKKKTGAVKDFESTELKEVSSVKVTTFDLKVLLSQLPATNDKAYIQQIPVEVTREHRNGLIYQNHRPRPLGECRLGARNFGAGQVVFTRRSDNLRAALNALFPSQETFRCTSEIKSSQEDIASETAVSSSLDYHSDSQPGSRVENQRLDDYCDSFTSSHPNSPDKILDLFDPDILEKSDDFLTDTYSWPGDPADKLSNKLFSLPHGSKPNIPKLKVDTNQIKTNSAMAVFEFDDPEEGRRAKEEERMRVMRGGGGAARKNKRKIAKSPSSQCLTPKCNGMIEQGDPSSSTFNSKRGRYEVIELDKSPTPPSSSPIKHCVVSPRQYSYMVGYGEQSAT